MISTQIFITVRPKRNMGKNRKKYMNQCPYWAGCKNGPQWIGKNIDLWASVEPSGIQISGIMPGDIWEEWYSLLKRRLTDVLGYKLSPKKGMTLSILTN